LDVGFLENHVRDCFNGLLVSHGYVNVIGFPEHSMEQFLFDLVLVRGSLLDESEDNTEISI
jgi:hypothetical protein